jgi:hypothetical protein
VTEAPEEAGDTTGRGRAHDPSPEEPLWQVFRVPSFLPRPQNRSGVHTGRNGRRPGERRCVRIPEGIPAGVPSHSSGAVPESLCGEHERGAGTLRKRPERAAGRRRESPQARNGARPEGDAPQARNDGKRPRVIQSSGVVSVRWAVGADVCGALGCRETGGLLQVEQDGETRVLCPPCARGWVGR